jgi:segregation and condensation protein B
MNNTSPTNPEYLSQAIEAILFATAEAYTIASLAKMLNVSVEEIESALSTLEMTLADHAFMLVRQGDTAILATRPDHSELLETIRKEELQKDLSKASAETLAVVIYHPGASKAEIELIRGVNASYSLRALQIRGLVETKNNGRTVAYYPTVALLESYGVADVELLPRYAETKQKIDSLL